VGKGSAAKRTAEGGFQDAVKGGFQLVSLFVALALLFVARRGSDRPVLSRG